MEIANSEIYLGVEVGSLAGASVWLGALRNYASRIDDIAKAHECVPLSVGAYNSLALSTFGYIA